MSAAEEQQDIEVEYVYDDGTWTVSVALGATTLIIETEVGVDESLATVVGSLPQIVNAAWTATENELAQEAP